MLFIGDVHGDRGINRYWKLLTKENPDKSRQVGDFGFKKHHDWFIDNIQESTKIEGDHKINFGNHDYTPYKYMDYSTGDYSYEEDTGVFYIRGALSIDKNDTWRRIEGVSWFRDEELSYSEWDNCINLYEEKKPRIVVSHDCPREVCESIFNIKWEYNVDFPKPSLTHMGLQNCFEIHQPDIWIFGHHHEDKDVMVNGTRFICLAELSTFSI